MKSDISAFGGKKMKKLLLMISLLLTAAMLSGKEIVLDVDTFADTENWSKSIFLGVPALVGNAKDAQSKTSVNIDNSGSYYLWARVATHGENYRRTSIWINKLKRLTAGDEKVEGKLPLWHWVKAKRPIQLNAGKNLLELRAEAPFARIASIILSDDADFTPGDESQSENKEVYSREKEGIFPRPLPKGDGPDMLLLNGGRPWIGNSVASNFASGGYRVKLLNSVYLDGMGGASIKITPNDPVEPEPLDGITPEFERLNRYKIIVINDIPTDMQRKLLTQERMEKLRNFVSSGGALLLTCNAPLDTLGDLAPVEKHPDVDSDDDSCSLPDFFVRRPELEQFQALPESWKLWQPFYLYKLKAGAKMVSEILLPDGDTAETPYIATMDYGKGKVLFWNSKLSRMQNAQQLFNWAYKPALITAIAATICPGKGVDPAKTTVIPPRESTSSTLPEAKVVISDPVMQFDEKTGNAQVEGKTITFENGVKIEVKSDSVDIFYPGIEQAVIHDLKFPEITLPKGSDKVDSMATAEAVGTKSEILKSKISWQVEAISGGEEAVITLADGENRCRWIFSTGKLELDGRSFFGIGQKIEIDNLPDKLLAGIVLNYQVDVDNTLFRRFACYQAPRGYKNFDFSGAVNSDTKRWGFFSDGQPFSYLEGKKAVFVELVNAPAAVSTQYQAKKGDKNAFAQTTFRFGRVKAPQATPVFYQLLGAPEYNTSNDWIALYQFVRHYLRQKNGFPEIPARPVADSSNTCTKYERIAVTRAAAKFGFTSKKIGVCPFPMESFETIEVLDLCDECKDAGIDAYPWFPCCHSPAETRTVVEHPDWYNHDETGKPTKYFGHFYTADMNNPEFFKWHLSVIDKMFDHGVKAVWYDMAGAASGTVNFATPESRIALFNQIEIFRHYYDKGGRVVSEGQNPLVLDGYIFRETVYNDPVGNEFAMVGAQIDLGGWRCDFFRLAMYDIFFPIVLDPLVLNFEYKLGGIANIERAVSFVPSLNKILDSGMPFIRETPFGTSWISEKGGALFFWDGVENFTAELPDDFVAQELVTSDKTIALDGKLPTTLPPESIVIFSRGK